VHSHVAHDLSGVQSNGIVLKLHYEVAVREWITKGILEWPAHKLHS
jgi:hypothetical protein